MSANPNLQASSIPNRLADNNYDLIAVLDLFKEDVMNSINCHAVGTIQSFDSEDQTAIVQISYLRTMYTTSPTNGQYIPSYPPYPLLVDVPVLFLGGGASNLTFPVANGDQCVVLFNDRSLDNWTISPGVAPVNSTRAHALYDAMCIVGMRSPATALETFDTARALLTSGTFKIGVGPAGVYISNGTNTLNTLLQQLITEIKNLVTATAAITVTPGSLVGPSSPPLNAAAITAIGATLTTTATAIGALLE